MNEFHGPSPDLRDALAKILGDRLATSTAVRDHHSHDESHHEGHLPDAVAFPTTVAR